MFKDKAHIVFPAPQSPINPSHVFFVPPVHDVSLMSSLAPDPAAQPDLPGGADLLRGILPHLCHDSDRCGGQDAQLSQEERLQQPDGCAQAGQEHPTAQTGNRK